MATAIMQPTYREDAFGLWDGQLVVTEKVSDEVLATAYMRFKQEGLLEYIFYEHVPTLTWFMNWFTWPTVDVLACLKKEEDGSMKLAGLTWLNSRIKIGSWTKAEVGHAYFREFQNGRDTIRWSRLSISYVFNFLAVDALFGVTPEPNKSAVRASRKIGFEVTGPVFYGYTTWKGDPCRVYISSVDKATWSSRMESE